MNLLTASDLSNAQLHQLFSRAGHYETHYRPGVKFPELAGATVALAFFENSTRTRLSFELAATRLSADVLTFSAATSSLAKGESFCDTIRTIDAMLVDAYVIRNQYAGVPQMAAQITNATIINAGDGKHEHPTQALLDAYTILKHYKKFEGLKITIIGDILHSRVARSNITMLQTLGATVRLLAPGTLLPPHLNCWNLELHQNIDDAIKWSDAIIMLRLQKERMDSGFLPSVAEFVKLYQLNLERFKKNDKLILLHPGPVNYGIELDWHAARHHNAMLERQVTSGVFTRMAVMAAALNGIN